MISLCFLKKTLIFTNALFKQDIIWYNIKVWDTKICEGESMIFDELVCRLADAGIENARGEAEMLIEELLGLPLTFERDYCSELLENAIKKRIEGYPLQYILGKWWFCRCEFEVNENCLVPRPDTEILVEQAANLLPDGARFADLCTGSGCIAISLCDLRQDISGVAVELYPKTLDLARKNAHRNNVSDRLNFICGDVLCGEGLDEQKFSAIISNPPYIRSEVIDTLSREVGYEPRAALDGGGDGLMFYRAIVEKYQRNLTDEGIFIFEIGYDQAEDIKRIARQNGFFCEIKKDLGGCDRMAILKKT